MTHTVCICVHANIQCFVYVRTYLCCMPHIPSFPWLQVCANTIIFAATNLVDVCYNYISDTARRKSFSETRRFIRSLIAIGLENRKVVSKGRGGEGGGAVGSGNGSGGKGEGNGECSATHRSVFVYAH